MTNLTFSWMQPTVSSAMLPIIAYRVYWDAAYLISGKYTLLSEIDSYN